MNIDEAKRLSYSELRNAYRTYLQSCDLSPNTIQTSFNDGFYLWRKSGEEVFWAAVGSTDFEHTAKTALLAALIENSSGDPQKLIHGYMAHLRRFKRFLALEAPVNSKIRTPSVHAPTYKIQVPAPCPAQLEMYLAKWNALEDYRLQEDALDKLFLVLCPENRSISDILLKVATLNDFYSTNIFSVYPVAKHILELSIDQRLQAGDVTLVDDIKKVIINGKVHNFYSFATKFCSHHKPSDYPIYDSYVDKILLYFKKRDRFADFLSDDLKDYAKFKDILIRFRRFYRLDKYSLKEIDKYLWQLGKEYFPKSYGKKKTEVSI